MDPALSVAMIVVLMVASPQIHPFPFVHSRTARVRYRKPMTMRNYEFALAAPTHTVSSVGKDGTESGMRARYPRLRQSFRRISLEPMQRKRGSSSSMARTIYDDWWMLSKSSASTQNGSRSTRCRVQAAPFEWRGMVDALICVARAARPRHISAFVAAVGSILPRRSSLSLAQRSD